jgi:hypothetical protein
MECAIKQELESPLLPRGPSFFLRISLRRQPVAAEGTGAEAFKTDVPRCSQVHVKQEYEKERGNEQPILPLILSRGLLSVLRCQVLGGREGEQDGFVKVENHVLVLRKVHQILPRSDSRLLGTDEDGSVEGLEALSYAHWKYKRIRSTRLR